MVQGSLNPNITIIGEKLWPEAWNKKILVLYKENIENAYKKRNNFRVSGFILQPIIKDRPNTAVNIMVLLLLTVMVKLNQRYSTTTAPSFRKRRRRARACVLSHKLRPKMLPIYRRTQWVVMMNKSHAVRECSKMLYHVYFATFDLNVHLSYFHLPYAKCDITFRTNIDHC